MEKRCEEIESEIERYEAEIAGYEAELANFKNTEETIRLSRMLKQRREGLATLLKEWEEVTQLIGANK
jgi:predicted RNase H-like nuclease (RuvC/YqgF family)